MVKNTMLKPPIVRMGGKSRLRKTIIDMLPEHTCYVELFFGAGWVYFGKEPSKVEVVNDVDKELINLFKMIKYHGPEVERMLEYEFSGRDIFEEYKNSTLEHLTDIHRAIRFLYLINNSFAGKGKHFGYGTTKIPNQKIFLTEYLNEIKERLNNTYDREESLFFCDPPYFETAGYDYEFTEDDHILLRDKLSNIKGKFILTINDHEKVREWYKDFNIEEVDVNYSISKEKSGRGKYKELIITNY